MFAYVLPLTYVIVCLPKLALQMPYVILCLPELGLQNDSCNFMFPQVIIGKVCKFPNLL